MTRARTLKTTIRARMAKTGERYTAARRHVVAAATATTTATAPDRSTSRPAVAADPRGAVSDAKVRERTGHDLAYWFDVLDRFGAADQGHTASARHLHEAHGVDGWYCQGITVAYERARGLRTINQRMSGSYEVSITKMLDCDSARVCDVLSAVRTTTGWTRGLDRGLVRALVAGVRGPGARGFVPASKDSRRCRFRWDGLPAEMQLSPRPGDRTQVVVAHRALPSRDLVDARRTAWRAALAALAEALGARTTARAATPSRTRATRSSRSRARAVARA